MNNVQNVIFWLDLWSPKLFPNNEAPSYFQQNFVISHISIFLWDRKYLKGHVGYEKAFGDPGAPSSPDGDKRAETRASRNLEKSPHLPKLPKTYVSLWAYDFCSSDCETQHLQHLPWFSTSKQLTNTVHTLFICSCVVPLAFEKWRCGKEVKTPKRPSKLFLLGLWTETSLRFSSGLLVKYFSLTSNLHHAKVRHCFLWPLQLN